MKPTYRQARDKVILEMEEDQRVDTCIQANICPICGGQLKKKPQFLGLFYRLICSTNREHFNKGGYFNDDGGC